MHVDIDSNSTYATVTYNWEFKGERQEGTLIICGNKKGNATMGWVDSFHQSSSVLHLEGEELSSGGVKTSGKWKAGEELWGWTIAIELVKEELLFNMEVVTPKGEATWAVKATYRRD